jgi:hypothetical protein
MTLVEIARPAVKTPGWDAKASGPGARPALKTPGDPGIRGVPACWHARPALKAPDWYAKACGLGVARR